MPPSRVAKANVAVEMSGRKAFRKVCTAMAISKGLGRMVANETHSKIGLLCELVDETRHAELVGGLRSLGGRNAIKCLETCWCDCGRARCRDCTRRDIRLNLSGGGRAYNGKTSERVGEAEKPCRQYVHRLLLLLHVFG